jgi:hypothetical protein
MEIGIFVDLSTGAAGLINWTAAAAFSKFKQFRATAEAAGVPCFVAFQIQRIVNELQMWRV